jgi:DMSO/TMAO reductase YedYZ molybdopterin-dependent catalytic subunit
LFDHPDPAHSTLTFDKEIRTTPVDQFYVQAWQDIPEVDATAWSLSIDGLVDNPLVFTFDEIRAMERVTVMRTLQCISNPIGGALIGNTTWTGTALSPLLKRAGIRSSAVRARMDAADRYMNSILLDWLLQPDTLLVYEMDGEPLTAEHGFPLRLMIPGLYGQKMPKWITRMEFIDHNIPGYWEHYGWSDSAEVKTTSQIVMPEHLASVHGTLVLQGWAYAGKRDIVSVEIKVDDGPWLPCRLNKGPSPLVWTQWWAAWTPTHMGTSLISVRATDNHAFTQHDETQELLASSYPDGPEAIHRIALNATPLDAS